MKFGEIPVTQAKGAILAHSISLPDGRIAKGHRLEQQDLIALQNAGINGVTVAQLDFDELGEDAAAQALGSAFCAGSTNITASEAHTGRVNLFAECNGIVEINVDAIHAFNTVNPMITVSTVPQYQRLSKGDMIATIKIISYGVPELDVKNAEATAKSAIVLRRAERKRAALIETAVAAHPVSSKGAASLGVRLERLDASLEYYGTCSHDVVALKTALDGVGSDIDIIFILTASATSDPADTGPAGLLAAGGCLEHFGMPVDPGNLLFLGRIGSTPVIGLPGCARALALNGADWILERVICGVPVSSRDIQHLGVGGLLKEIAQRGRLRDPSGRRR